VLLVTTGSPHPLIFLDGTGKSGVQASDYLEQVLEPVVAPAFQGYESYRAKQEGDERDNHLIFSKKRLCEHEVIKPKKTKTSGYT
jgi:hypothetical protein